MKLFGWKIELPPTRVPKSVICIAPHTSNLDFFIGSLYARAIGQKASFMMKKEMFFFPFGPILRKLGGIAIDRMKRESIVEKIVSCFSKDAFFSIAITPEGTRKAVKKWKSGFYKIALQANVPIQLAKIDFSKKIVGIFEIFHPTGNEEKDLKYIQMKYTKDQAKHPNNFIEHSKES